MAKRVSFAKNWSRDDIIAEIRSWVRDQEGRVPKYRDWVKTMADPSASIIQRKFGGWGEALVAAGYEPHVVRRPRPKPVQPAAAPPTITIPTVSQNEAWDQIFLLLQKVVDDEAEEKAQRLVAERLEKMREVLS